MPQLNIPYYTDYVSNFILFTFSPLMLPISLTSAVVKGGSFSNAKTVTSPSNSSRGKTLGTLIEKSL